MELTGKIADISMDFITGKTKLTLEINEKQEALGLYDNLHNEPKLSIDIDKYKEKKSSDANRYMWSLCGKLAEALSKDGVVYTKDDIYKQAIRECGIWRDDEVHPDDVEWRCAAWAQIGKGWLTERVDFTADGEKELIRFYYGSSRYNKKQMSRLIDNIVQDCKAEGIETKTPRRIAELISLWEAGEKRYKA